MARKPSPWYRQERDAWFVMIDGRQRLLGAHPKDSPKPRKRKGSWNAPPEIVDEFHRLMVAPAEIVPADPQALLSLLDKFLDWCEKHRPDSYHWYAGRINEFAKTVAAMFLGESLSWRHGVGGLLIVCGAILVAKA